MSVSVEGKTPSSHEQHDVAVVGAGIAGLACLKTLSQAGCDVIAIDHTPDIGGVWSATRRYPGLRTQNSKFTYCFSDLPMSDDISLWPTGKEMQSYLTDYVTRNGLTSGMRLNTEVLQAVPVPEGWTLWVRDLDTGIDHEVTASDLIIATGVFSDPQVPQYAGVDRFQEAGGTLCHASAFTDLEAARDKDVMVVGYGKSACDIAEAISDVARTTKVVARRLMWKAPRVARSMSYEQLVLTRLGEAAFGNQHKNLVERFLHGPGRPLRDRAFDYVQRRVSQDFRLDALGLVPDGRFEELAVSSLSLITEGFYEKVAAGQILVHRDRTIAALGGNPSRYVRLSDGTEVAADLVICATGFRQDVPFLPTEVQRRLLDERGNYLLYRHILPFDVPHLSFCGFNSSVISALSAEVSAVWILGYLTGKLSLPPDNERRVAVAQRLQWQEWRTGGRHARGTSVAPFSLNNIDAMLSDLGTALPARTRLRQWFKPVNPHDYGPRIRQVVTRARAQLAVNASSDPGWR